jgi:hypothetical protein
LEKDTAEPSIHLELRDTAPVLGSFAMPIHSHCHRAPEVGMSDWTKACSCALLIVTISAPRATQLARASLHVCMASTNW